jgi:hypothetical protein
MIQQAISSRLGADKKGMPSPDRYNDVISETRSNAKKVPVGPGPIQPFSFRMETSSDSSSEIDALPVNLLENLPKWDAVKDNSVFQDEHSQCSSALDQKEKPNDFVQETISRWDTSPHSCKHTLVNDEHLNNAAPPLRTIDLLAPTEQEPMRSHGNTEPRASLHLVAVVADENELEKDDEDKFVAVGDTDSPVGSGYDNDRQHASKTGNTNANNVSLLTREKSWERFIPDRSALDGSHKRKQHPDIMPSLPTRRRSIAPTAC